MFLNRQAGLQGLISLKSSILTAVFLGRTAGIVVSEGHDNVPNTIAQITFI